MAADEKKTRKSAALYDHETSKRRRGEEAEGKKEPKGDTKSKEDAKPAPGKAEGDAKGADTEKKPAEGDKSGEGDNAKSPQERHSEERAALIKAHEGERRDLHGNHRDEHRKMATRQEKALQDLYARHETDLASGAAPAAGAPAEGVAEA